MTRSWPGAGARGECPALERPEPNRHNPARPSSRVPHPGLPSASLALLTLPWTAATGAIHLFWELLAPP